MLALVALSAPVLHGSGTAPCPAVSVLAPQQAELAAVRTVSVALGLSDAPMRDPHTLRFSAANVALSRCRAVASKAIGLAREEWRLARPISVQLCRLPLPVAVELAEKALSAQLVQSCILLDHVCSRSLLHSLAM